MTSLLALWLPILLSAVACFIVSSVIHMMSPWHKNDYPMLPDQDRFASAVGPMNIPPGDYMVPRPATRAELRTPEFLEKMKRGPVVMMTVMPNGMMSMGRNMGLWFVYLVVVATFAAYVAAQTLGPGADHDMIRCITGVTAFLGYAAALWQMSIWYLRAWSTTIKATVDGLIYALITAFIFGWLWPR